MSCEFCPASSPGSSTPSSSSRATPLTSHSSSLSSSPLKLSPNSNSTSTSSFLPRSPTSPTTAFASSHFSKLRRSSSGSHNSATGKSPQAQEDSGKSSIFHGPTTKTSLLKQPPRSPMRSHFIAPSSSVTLEQTVVDTREEEEAAEDDDVALGLDDEERGALESANAYFVKYLQRGKMESQKYAAKSEKTSDQWLAYGNGSLNWDSLCTIAEFLTTDIGSTFEIVDAQSETPRVPRKVLDIGCGSCNPTAILEMAQRTGWSKTTFVGLDIAPVVLALPLLPLSIACRLSFVIADFTKKLPFASSSFDLIRIARVGLSLGEDKWNDLVEEACRVLSSDGIVQVVEGDFSILRPHLSSPLDAKDDTIFSAFDTVLNNRGINPRFLSNIPAALALNCRDVKSSGRQSLNPSASPFDPPGQMDSKGDGTRVLLHAYTERYAGSSQLIAEEEATRRLSSPIISNFALFPPPSPTSATPSRARSVTFGQLHRSIETELKAWTDDLKERAGVGGLLEKRFGWACEMDLQGEKLGEEYLPIWQEQMDQIDREMNEAAMSKVGEEEGEGEVEVERAARRTQIMTGMNQARLNLAEVKKRLLRDWKEGENVVVEAGLGKVEYAAWTAKACK